MSPPRLDDLRGEELRRDGALIIVRARPALLLAGDHLRRERVVPLDRRSAVRGGGFLRAAGCIKISEDRLDALFREQHAIRVRTSLTALAALLSKVSSVVGLAISS